MISEKQWSDFFAELAKRGNVLDSCKASGVGRSTVYEHIAAGDATDATPEAKEWTARYQAALDDSVDRLDGEAYRRAFDGVPEPVFQGGVLVGHVQKYSDGLLQFLLRARRPGTYKSQTSTELSGPGGRPIQTESRVMILPAIPEGAEE